MIKKIDSKKARAKRHARVRAKISGTPERRSALFRKNEALSASFDESAFPGRYAWIDTLEDARLLRAIMKLNKKDLELLTYVTLEGHGQEELARRWGCTQAAVAIRMKKIKKIFQTTL